ncbi:hypothetical protein BD413DRAFT_295764 [Trametes elegans]|nr:hypothetical protein BD413DRAFT_295764 [Trametes elegans]
MGSARYNTSTAPRRTSSGTTQSTASPSGPRTQPHDAIALRQLGTAVVEARDALPPYQINERVSVQCRPRCWVPAVVTECAHSELFQCIVYGVEYVAEDGSRVRIRVLDEDVRRGKR